MPRLQPCPKCSAQFDVEAMAVGTAFTCGACGGVVTVAGAGGAAVASRVPPAPSRPIPAPSRTPGGPSRPGAAPAAAPARASARGPQYVPVDRHREAPAAPAPSRRGGGDDAPRARGRAAAGRKPGMSPAALAGVSLGGLAVVGLVAFLVLGKKDKPEPPPLTPTPLAGGPSGTPAASATAGTPAGAATASPTGPAKPGPTPAGGADTLAALEAEYGAKKYWPKEDLKRFFERFKALGAPAASRTKALAEQIVLEDGDYAPARTLLGYTEFNHPVPEMIAFTKAYPYIRAVEEANKQRWFGPDEARELELANHSWEKTLAHAKKLDPDTGDSTFRALDGARQAINRDKHFKDYNYEAIFASPYLICYSSDDRLTEEDLLAIPKKDRQAKLAELEKKRASYMRVLAEKAKIYQQLYAEFLKRYAEDCDLKDLMKPYGGRADLPPGKRSFKDGCPMIIWIFSDRSAFEDFHNNVVKSPIPTGVAGYFSPLNGWVYLYDEPDNREFEINKNVHEGTHQLEHWFQRQKREWGPTSVPQSFFGEGFAEYVGAVNMAKDRTLTFHGINWPRLEFLHRSQADLKSRGQKLPIFPTKILVGFEGYHKVNAWAAENWKMEGLGVFYAQSWAFVYFLNEALAHKYQAKFNRFLDDMLNHPRDAEEGWGFNKFKEAFAIKSEDDWKKLQTEFEKYYLETLIPMFSQKPAMSPPSREDWPGYVPVEPVDPTK